MADRVLLVGKRAGVLTQAEWKPAR